MVQIPDKVLKEKLVKAGLITEEEFEKVLFDAKRMGQSTADILISRNYLKSDYYTGLLAEYFGVPLAKLSTRSIDESVLRLLPENIAKQKRVIIFRREKDGSLNVAMNDPNDLTTIEFLSSYLKAKIKPFLATGEDLNRGYALYGRRSAEEFRKIIEDNIKASLQAQIYGKSAKEAAAEVPIVAIVDNILSYAIASRASDIHLEILEENILVRYRIDGVLHEITRIPKEVHPPIAARFKLLSGLRLDEHSKPQDGRFRFQASGGDVIDIRVSVIPTFYGEKVEMRLLEATSRPLSFEELGMLEDTIKVVKENIAKTYGIILITGPTGSGKTTTLYSIINVLNRPEVNINTIEDPIEYEMKYVNQMQVNPQAGITFASGLRALLRQDPNIILVGEIRDSETGDIAVQAALTGHLVLSTLHTNDAPTAVPRLFDMKIEPFLVAAVLNMIMAQRLVRRICQDCITSFKVTPEIANAIKNQFKGLELENPPEIPKTLYKGEGCSVCGGLGYKGRLSIYENMNVDEEIRNEIVNPNFTLDNLKKILRKKGFVTMFEDGLRKAERGMTTIEEILRVIRE
ncbi:MAG: type II/IV secretion system protein [Candidatus Harrisonbacteria bacterium]|nr:type II/IV secretion system protein [Candidatus Harrisonbacteria bacterium]